MNQITCHMAPGEGVREDKLRAALQGDKRFDPLVVSASNVVDLQFFGGEVFYELQGEKICDCRVLNVELKEPQDFVQSVLNGHLCEQVLSCREARQDACVVILGTIDEIYEAIKNASKLRKGKYLRGAELSQAIASNHLRCKSFRKRSFLNGVPIFYINDDSGFFDSKPELVWKDILELAHDCLLDGKMTGFAIRPPDNEREVIAASMLFSGIGPSVIKEVLRDYKLAFVPKGTYARPIEELPNIGPKRAKQINERVVIETGSSHS